MDPSALNVDDLLTLIHSAERLEALPRTGWITCGVTHPESIAAHSYNVTLIALWIADHIEQEVDTEKVLRMALLHDMGESLLTDLPAPVKHLIGIEQVRKAEHQCAHTILKHAPPKWGEAYDSHADRTQLEARILKAADTIQMLAKSLQYRQQHRGDVSQFWDTKGPRQDFGIPLVRTVLDRLQAHWEAGTWITSVS